MPASSVLMMTLPVVVVPIVVMGRRLRGLSRVNQDWIAASSGTAAEAIGAAQAVQAFTHEGPTRKAFADVIERSFETAMARISRGAA